MFNINQPYQELPYLPPTETLVTPKIVEAHAETISILTQLNNLYTTSPHQTLVTDYLALLEARDSLAIENMHVSIQELVQSRYVKPNRNPITKQALTYQHLVATLDPNLITVNMMKQIVSALLNYQTDVRHMLDVYIGRGYERIYTPPRGQQLLLTHLYALEPRLNTSPTPVLEVPFTHWQFETIHPFIDGNGRTGRVLNALLLRQYCPLVLNLSTYLYATRADYYRLLGVVRQTGKWEEWVCYVLEGITVAAKHAIALLTELQVAQKQALMKLANVKIPARRIIELTYSKPVLTVRDFTKEFQISYSKSTAWIKQLLKLEILRRNPEKTAPQVFYNLIILDYMERGLNITV